MTAVALGALVYSAINSAGYYANKEKMAAVGTFAVVTLLAAASILVLLDGLLNL